MRFVGVDWVREKRQRQKRNKKRSFHSETRSCRRSGVFHGPLAAVGKGDLLFERSLNRLCSEVRNTEGTPRGVPSLSVLSREQPNPGWRGEKAREAAQIAKAVVEKAWSTGTMRLSAALPQVWKMQWKTFLSTR